MISLHRYLTYTLMVMLFVVSGCGTGTKQSPVASDSLESGEEVGTLSEDSALSDEYATTEDEESGDELSDESSMEESDAEDEQVAEKTYVDSYTVQSGDSLSSIAAKEEIYGDAALWPILQQYNRDTLGNSQSVNVGSVLKIPRRLTSEEKNEALEKARQASAVASGESVKQAASEDDSEITSAGTQEEKEEEVTQAPVVEPETVQEVQPKVETAPTERTQRRAKPKSKGMMLILIVIFVVLLGAAFILFYFMKKDNDAEEV